MFLRAGPVAEVCFMRPTMMLARGHAQGFRQRAIFEHGQGAEGSQAPQHSDQRQR